MYVQPLRPDELYHFGRLGMKWGQHIFGSDQPKAKYSKYTGKTETIPKGASLYRVTVNKDEPTSGNKYMTYYQSDRNYYRSNGGGWIASVNNKDFNDLHEKTYVTTKDIKIPSTDKMYDTLKKVVIDDSKQRVEAGKAVADFYLTNRGYGDKSTKLSKAYDKEVKSGKEAVEKYLKDRETVLAYNYLYKSGVSESLNAMSGKDKQDAIMAATAGFGSARGAKIKDKVIAELKKEGYTGMTDYAGVGGHFGWQRETRQTLVIFDTDKNLKEVSTENLNKANGQKYYNDYNKWRQKALKEDRKKQKRYNKR